MRRLPHQARRRRELSKVSWPQRGAALSFCGSSPKTSSLLLKYREASALVISWSRCSTALLRLAPRFELIKLAMWLEFNMQNDSSEDCPAKAGGALRDSDFVPVAACRHASRAARTRRTSLRHPIPLRLARRCLGCGAEQGRGQRQPHGPRTPVPRGTYPEPPSWWPTRSNAATSRSSETGGKQWNDLAVDGVITALEPS